MARRIQILPDALANQIAAGEVVERPASVVKELVENALDAAATRIEIEVRNGGKTLIRVADDGCGMGRDDALLALDRHATSKITRPEDLRAVRTFGFRGEALPAIASVSRFSLETAEAGGVATRVRAAGGRITGVEDCARQPGTTVAVQGLFFNVPARAKFLRSAGAETRAVAEVVTTLALTHLSTGLRLLSNGRVLLDLPPASDLVSRVAALWGDEAASQLIAVAQESPAARIAGLVDRPDAALAGARRVRLFVAGRPFRDPTLVRAAERAYRTTVPQDVRPSLLLYLEVPAGGVDVNVHPTKAEVRFRDAAAVEAAVEEGVRAALRGIDSAATLDRRPALPQLRRAAAAGPGLESSDDEPANQLAFFVAAPDVDERLVARAERADRGERPIERGRHGEVDEQEESEREARGEGQGARLEGTDRTRDTVRPRGGPSEDRVGRGTQDGGQAAGPGAGSEQRGPGEGAGAERQPRSEGAGAAREAGGGHGVVAAAGLGAGSQQRGSGERVDPGGAGADERAGVGTGQPEPRRDAVSVAHSAGAPGAEPAGKRASGSAGAPSLWQIHETYLVAETRSGLLIIDQHSAHERILFEELMRGFRDGGVVSQRLLFPITLRLSPAEFGVVADSGSFFEAAGFQVEEFGGRSVIVHAVPAPHPYFDAERCLRDMLAELATGSELTRAAKNQYERIAMTFACKGAIKAGQRLSPRASAELFERLFTTELPYHDVHGRPTVVRLSLQELGRRFGREG